MTRHWGQAGSPEGLSHGVTLVFPHVPRTRGGAVSHVWPHRGVAAFHLGRTRP